MRYSAERRESELSRRPRLRPTDEDVELTCRIIATARDEYEKQCDGTFVVFIHPLSLDVLLTERVAKRLTEMEVPIVWHRMTPGEECLQYFISPYDRDPNAAMNMVFSEYMYEYIAKNIQ